MESAAGEEAVEVLGVLVKDEEQAVRDAAAAALEAVKTGAKPACSK